MVSFKLHRHTLFGRIMKLFVKVHTSSTVGWSLIFIVAFQTMIGSPFEMHWSVVASFNLILVTTNSVHVNFFFARASM
jgi:hypothetical protein